jgi:uncharacterized protein YkwD
MKRLNLLVMTIILSACYYASSSFAQVVDEDESETIDISSPDFPIIKENLDLEKAANLLVDQSNVIRSRHDRSPLEVNEALREAAEYFANYMATHDKYGHTADDQRPADRAEKYGYDYCIVAENIAYQYSSRGFTEEDLARRFVDAWEQSPKHYKNMIDPDLLETGVAVARSKKSGYYYAVQMFGRPKSAAIHFQFANRTDETIEYECGGERLPLPPSYIRVHEECRPDEVTFYLPSPDGETSIKKTIKPKDGDEFVIVRSKGKFEVLEK